MTDSKKLDFLVDKVTSLEVQGTALTDKVGKIDERVSKLDEKVSQLDKKVTNIEEDIIDIKDDIRKLQRFDTLILDEVERVHSILDKHKADTTIHTA